MQACRDGNYDKVKCLMPGCTQESRAIAREHGKPFLTAACNGNHTNIVKWFMDHGATIDEELAVHSCIKNARRFDIQDDLQLFNYERAFKRALVWGFDDGFERMFKLYILTKAEADKVKTDTVSNTLHTLIYDTSDAGLEIIFNQHCLQHPVILDGVDWNALEAFARERNKFGGFERLKVIKDAFEARAGADSSAVAQESLRVPAYSYAQIAAKIANKVLVPFLKKHKLRNSFVPWAARAQQRINVATRCFVSPSVPLMICDK